MDLKEISLRNQTIGWKIIDELNIIPLWEAIGATVHLVGSLKTGLMMKNKDIDFHIYTDELTISDSFSVIEKLAENSFIKEIHYQNLIHTEEACIEWHVIYKDGEKNRWKLDMIHILKGSRYDGVVESVTSQIEKCLTPELAEIILRIKFDIPEDVHIPSIQLYRAVFSHGIRHYEEFREWQKTAPSFNLLEWRPDQRL